MIRIAKLLNDTEAALIFTQVNRRYLTGFNSSLGYLFISKKDKVLFVDGRYFIAAKSTVSNCQVVLIDNISEQLNSLAKMCNIKTIFTENTISVAEFDCFSGLFKDVEVIANKKLTDEITTLRSVKTDDEIGKIISAQKTAEKAFIELLNFIKPGVSERSLATELEYRMKLLGSEGESFDTIVVSGVKSAMPHGVPDEKLIEKGDFVTLDFGAVYDGYHSDMTRTVAVGFATDKMYEVYNTVLKANHAVEKIVRDGLTCREADFAARSVIENAGYGQYFTHSTGHSLGLEIHEAPNLSVKNETKLKSGQIVTNEPGIYIEGLFGVRIEDMLLVEENGCKNLTDIDKSLIIL